MDYPPAVVRHFQSPSNVGPLASAPSAVFRGEAGSTGRGAWVVIEAEIEGARIARIAFRAYGCPYVIAACSRVTEMLTGASADALAGWDPAALVREFDAPPGKLGSLLIIQDALRNCFRDWDTTQPAAAR